MQIARRRLISSFRRFVISSANKNINRLAIVRDFYSTSSAMASFADAQGGSNMTKEEFEKFAAISAKDAELKEIMDLYTKLANQPEHDYGWGTGPENAKALGYKAEWVDGFPSKVFESDAAGGCPFTLGDITEGMHVVDFGCGAGADGE